MTSTSNASGTPALRRRTMSTSIGPLVLVAGRSGLRAVLWPGEDGSRVAHAVGSVAAGSGAASSSAAGSSAAGSSAAGSSVAEVGADEAEAHLDRAADQLAQYFDGTRRDFDLDLDPVGTDFQLRVWAALRDIPYGQTRSYGAQAADLGAPGASRAVGAANGRNPLSIVVPCHRVVAASGALTGFAGGLDIKAWLLDHERAVLARG